MTIVQLSIVIKIKGFCKTNNDFCKSIDNYQKFIDSNGIAKHQANNDRASEWNNSRITDSQSCRNCRVIDSNFIKSQKCLIFKVIDSLIW